LATDASKELNSLRRRRHGVIGIKTWARHLRVNSSWRGDAQNGDAALAGRLKRAVKRGRGGRQAAGERCGGYVRRAAAAAFRNSSYRVRSEKIRNMDC
jgi:hypothetical protein